VRKEPHTGSGSPGIELHIQNSDLAAAVAASMSGPG
jgi:hypothetical protein